MTGPRVVILNDTATRYHHGCARVMRLLVAGLTEAGCQVTARIPARADWAQNPAQTAAIAAADVIVINGEGTLHDGAPAGARLLSVLDHPARGQKPVALINALWQDNPADWNRWAAALSLTAARDSASAAALTAAGAQIVRWLPDLSLSGDNPREQPRTGLIVGDSVRWSARKVLGRIAADRPALSLPTKVLSHPVWRQSIMKTMLWRAYFAQWTNRVPPFAMAPDEPAYLAALAAASGHITGRFHGVCLSMVTQTPFLALAANTSKVQRLLADAGLGDSRLITADALLAGADVPAFSATERTAIRDTRARARTEAARLFRDIRALA